MFQASQWVSKEIKMSRSSGRKPYKSYKSKPCKPYKPYYSTIEFSE